MKITNKLGLPTPFVDAATSDHVYEDGRYSVTQLLKGSCEAVLLRRHDAEIESDVANRVWAIFGSGVHEIIAKAALEDGQESEVKLATEFGNYTLSGIFDLYDAKTETVTDYKTTSVWKLVKGEYEDWRRQLLCYAVLLEDAGKPCKHGQIVAMLRDFSAADAAKRDDYPDFQVQRIHFDFSENDLAECREWIDMRFAEIAEQEAREDDALIPCDEVTRWQTPAKWAAIKAGAARATKVFEDETEAEAFAAEKGLEVEHRPGTPRKCLEYCDVRAFCPFGKLLETE